MHELFRKARICPEKKKLGAECSQGSALSPGSTGTFGREAYRFGLLEAWLCRRSRATDKDAGRLPRRQTQSRSADTFRGARL